MLAVGFSSAFHLLYKYIDCGMNTTRNIFSHRMKIDTVMERVRIKTALQFIYSIRIQNDSFVTVSLQYGKKTLQFLEATNLIGYLFGSVGMKETSKYEDENKK